MSRRIFALCCAPLAAVAVQTAVAFGPAAADETVAGVVIDGSGHGWPLYAKVAVRGDSGRSTFTDPYTGRYQLSVPSEARLVVTPQYRGYQAITTPAASTIAVPVDASACTAPGYAVQYSGPVQHFDGKVVPPGWTVQVLNAGGGRWTFSSNFRPNFTGGKGNFAIIDSAALDPDKTQDTALVSPPVDLSDESHPVIRLASTLAPLSTTRADIEYTIDRGASWHSAYTYPFAIQQGPLEVALPGAARHAAVQVRLHYRGGSEGFWEADDVYVGRRACQPVPGGLVVGTVADDNTGAGILSATVTGDHQVATTVATPQDPAQPDGLYYVFSPAARGAQFTAAKLLYASATKSLVVPADSVARLAFSLTTGRVTVTPDRIVAGTTAPGTARVSLRVSNTGGQSVHVRLVEGGADTSAMATGWHLIAPYPRMVFDNAAAYYGGKVYSVGGLDGVTFQALTAMYVYDPATNRWTRGPSMPHVHAGGNAAWIGGKLYVVGGSGNGGGGYGGTDAYDPRTNTWTTLTPNPVGTIEAGSAVIGGKLYVIGGFTDAATASTGVEIYDVASDTWTVGPDYPVPVSWESCGAIDITIYCAGGLGDPNPTLASAYAFDGTSWSPRANYPTDVYGAFSTVENDKLLVSGGVIDNNSTIGTRGWSYDPLIDRWSALPEAQLATTNGGSACGFVKVGGQVQGDITAQSEQLGNFRGCSDVDYDVPWLSESAPEFDLAPGESRTVVVTLDARRLSAGGYNARLIVRTDTPYPAPRIPVRFTVT